MKINKLIVLSLSCLLLFSCAKRPNMSYDQKDKGAVQDIESFNVESSAENFRKDSVAFNNSAKKILGKKSTELTSRRISLQLETVEKLNRKLKIIDYNFPIKNLEKDLVTFKFDNIDLRSALKLFASSVERNIIIGNEVQGKLTMDFEDIKWGSAVYVVLDMNNLVMTEDKDSKLLRVHSSEQFATLADKKIKQTIARNDSLASLDIDPILSSDNEEENTISEIFKIYYQKSIDVIPPLEAAVGENVTITDDENNNQLVVTASLQDLDRVDLALQEIDVERKQVMIEAYIISATDNFTKSFNANLELLETRDRIAGEDRITFTGISTNPGVSTPLKVPTKDNEDVETNDPAVPNSQLFDSEVNLAGGAFLIGNLGMARLKAVINASNTDNNSETISNPKLFAMDGNTSTLVQGIELLRIIPAAGDAAGSIEKIPQNLNIQVTPRVMGNEKVELDLIIANNTPGESTADATTTNTEAITAMVQIDSGDVAILGGVYKNVKTDNKQYVPILSSIPIIGSFFKQKAKSDGKTQLLIFLTANIV
jgi:type IV pilus assembly protein PilQ